MRLNSAFLEILVSGDDVDGLGAIIRGSPNSTVGNCGFLPSFTNSQQRRNVLETQENRELQGSAVL